MSRNGKRILNVALNSKNLILDLIIRGGTALPDLRLTTRGGVRGAKIEATAFQIIAKAQVECRQVCPTRTAGYISPETIKRPRSQYEGLCAAISSDSLCAPSAASREDMRRLRDPVHLSRWRAGSGPRNFCLG